MKSITVNAEHAYQVVFAKANSSSLAPALEKATRVAIIVPKDLQKLGENLEIGRAHV